LESKVLGRGSVPVPSAVYVIVHVECFGIGEGQGILSIGVFGFKSFCVTVAIVRVVF